MERGNTTYVAIRSVTYRALQGLLLYLSVGSVGAIDQIGVSLGDLQGAGWQAQDIRLDIDLPQVDVSRIDISRAADLTGDLNIATLQLPAPIGRVDGVRMRCALLVHDAKGTRCSGRLQAGQLLGQALSTQAQIEQDAATGNIRLRLQDLALVGGHWRIDADLQAGAWTLKAQGQRVDAAAALAMLKRFSPGIDYKLSGTMDLSADLHGTAAGISSLQFKLAAEGVEFANASGTQAGEKLRMELMGNARPRGADWQGEARIGFATGALFVDPLYLEFTPETALHLASKIHWSAATNRLRLTDLELDHTGVAQARADLQLKLGTTTTRESLMESVDLQVIEAFLPSAYVNYIQPWLHGRVGDALDTSGRFSGRYRSRIGGDTALQMRLRDVDIEDAGNRFGFHKLNATIDWANDKVARTTTLGWQSGSVYRLALGAAQLAVASQGTQFELREPVRIPVLDGQLLIDDLALGDPGEPNMQWRFDGVLTPVSMEAVCKALDWPMFGGQLSGMIPAVHYADGILEIGGVLLVHAFDGDLTVRNLRLEEPFGRVPRLNADLAVDNLDLDALTRTFEFGKIEGRLSGHVNHLYMEDWEPVAFEAGFATPENDKSRHRISQKAVDNLSSIGGGVGGALSRSFLGVFEEFPYDRLGLSCTLQNGVCRMGGVAAAANGYYIVKGRFLPPRIDVVGYADRVDWHTLIDRLKSVTLEQAPVVR